MDAETTCGALESQDIVPASQHLAARGFRMPQMTREEARILFKQAVKEAFLEQIRETQSSILTWMIKAIAASLLVSFLWIAVNTNWQHFTATTGFIQK